MAGKGHRNPRAVTDRSDRRFYPPANLENLNDFFLIPPSNCRPRTTSSQQSSVTAQAVLLSWLTPWFIQRSQRTRGEFRSFLVAEVAVLVLVKRPLQRGRCWRQEHWSIETFHLLALPCIDQSSCHHSRSAFVPSISYNMLQSEHPRKSWETCTSDVFLLTLETSTIELKDDTIIIVLGASGDLAKKKTVRYPKPVML